MRSTVRHLAILSAVITAAACSKREPIKATSEPLRVAAAADLRFAFKDVGDAFEKKTAQNVEFSFGSTGMLAKQIAKANRFDVFAAANVAFIDDVVKAGVCLADTKALYAIGRIAVWGKRGSGVPADLRGIADPRFGPIAVANPEHAPYGLAARQALYKSGL